MTADGTQTADAQTADTEMTADDRPDVTAEAGALPAVQAAARAARGAVADLASVTDEVLDGALRAMADQLGRRARAGPRAHRGGHRGARGGRPPGPSPGPRPPAA